MAQTFPNSQFVGIDYHDASIETAREHAAQAGVTNASFEVADATSYQGSGYDLIAFFDCLHDMAILLAPPVTRGRRSIPMGTACLSSLSRGIASRTTSIP